MHSPLRGGLSGFGGGLAVSSGGDIDPVISLDEIVLGDRRRVGIIVATSDFRVTFVATWQKRNQ